MIYVILMLVVGVLLIFVIASTQTKPSESRRQSRRPTRTGSLDRDFVQRKWSTIEAMTAGGGSLRDAVSEADKLLDYAMKQSGMRGETMGERLKYGRTRFSDINAVWSAHKLRNALAHEAQFDLVPSQAKEAINDFKRGLKDLGAL